MTTLSGTEQERRRELVDWAHKLGEQFAPLAAGHDRDGSFASEAFTLLKDSGYLAMAVPAELGGRGATVGEVAAAQRALARHCASTALASAMHHHVTLFTSWRYRRGMPGAEATLRRVAAEGLVLVSTGGADFARPRGRAERVDGGFRVSGRKVFCSQVPMGDVLVTMFPFDDPEDGRVVLNMAVPMGDGVRVVDNWDTLGMRGTGSNDVEIDDVFVPDERVTARRPYGRLDPPLLVIGSIAMCVVAAVYLGIAETAADAALATVAGTPKAEDPSVQRQAGAMVNRLRVLGWALDGAISAVGDDPDPDVERFCAAMAAKREIAIGGVEVCDLAMEVAGGAGYFRSSPIERCYRDIRAAKFHPLTPEATLLHAGKVALGVPADEV